MDRPIRTVRPCSVVGGFSNLGKCSIGSREPLLKPVRVCIPPVRSVGSIDAKRSVGQELDDPFSLVDGVMVLAAQRNKVVEVGGTPLFPFVNVVGLTPVDWSATPMPSAARVDGFEC